MSCDKDEYYLDNAATTPVDAEAITAAMPYYGSIFHNPASAHMPGQRAAKAIERARSLCAVSINAERDEIIFTSGGTEAINQAIKCAPIAPGSRIIISAIEHDAVVACAERMKSVGYKVDTVMPNARGTVTPEALEKLMGDDVSLVCVMTVNNITGAVQPVKELAKVAHKYGALFFTDAVQAVNSTVIDVKDSDADMLCVSAHKFYGMKGAGFLYVKRGIKMTPLIDGGSQERGLRAGTVDVVSVAAMGAAISRAVAYREEYNAAARAAKEAFLSALECGKAVEVDNGTDDIVSVVFGINGGRLAVALSIAGVYCSVGSACSAGSDTPPPALVAMGVKDAGNSVRFSFGKTTTEEMARQAAFIVNSTVKRL